MSTGTFDILGIDVAAIDMPRAVAELLEGVRQRQSRFYTARDVHGVMLAQHDAALMDIHSRAALNLPDGMPLVAFGRLKGYKVSRVAGPDFMLSVCQAGVTAGLRHFFYGGRQGIAEQAAENLSSLISGLCVVGAAAPPDQIDARKLDPDGLEMIKQARPDVVWLGLSTPKQEFWMDRHVRELDGISIIGVGAAFDIYAGRLTRPSAFMQRTGLEWLYRLVKEPRRLWRRYLILAPQFLIKVALRQLTGRSKMR